MARPRGTGRPTALKVVAGARKDRINTDEPQPQEGVPECPSDDLDVQDVWDYTIKQLMVMRTVTMADRDALHAYCEQVVVHRAALAMMKREGLVTYGPNMAMKHPAASIAKDAAAMIKSLGGAFGLNPAARSAIKVGDQQSAKQGAARLLTG